MKKSFAACLLALPLLSACYNPVLQALYPDKKIFGSPQALFAKAPAKPGDYTPARDYKPEEDARLRIYGRNYFSTIAYEDTDCTPKSDAIMVTAGNSWSDTTASFRGIAKNFSLGMPESDYSRQATGGQNGRAFYRELAARGGRPVTVQILSGGMPMKTGNTTTSQSCHVAVKFIPEAGKDYEAVYFEDGGRCGMQIQEIGGSAPRPVEVQRCNTPTGHLAKKNLKETGKAMLPDIPKPFGVYGLIYDKMKKSKDETKQ